MLFPWYTKYPYQNDEVLNLDWILKTIDNLVKEVSDFVSLNTIKYADPIQWNITTQYEKNTVVIDPISGSAYISTKPVPAGVGLNNTDYWNIIFTLDVISANKNITLRDDANNMLATFESVIGDWLLWQGTLYVVKRDISIGQAYVADYNIERCTVEMFLKEYLASLSNEINTIIGDLSDLNTEDKDSIVEAINSLLSSVSDIIGDLSELTTTNKDSVVDAINEVVSTLSDVMDTIGALQDLNTADKDSIVDAINEVVGYCGDLDNLNTTDKTSLVAAINEVVGEVGDTNTEIGDLTNLKTRVKTSIVSSINSLVEESEINVKAFGAKGDGVTDDTLAIQSAIDYCATNNILMLYFPYGTYKTSATLNITKELTLYSCKSATIRPTGNIGNAIKFQGTSQLPVSGGMYGIRVINDPNTPINNVQCSNYNSLKFEDCVFYFGSTAIDLRGDFISFKCVIDNCTLSDFSNAGVNIQTHNTSVVADTYISNSIINGKTTATGIKVLGICSGLYVSNNDIINCERSCDINAYGERIESCYFSNTLFDSPQQEGCRIIGSGLHPLYSILFTNCWFSNSQASRGVYVNHGEQVTFNGCTFLYNKQEGAYFISNDYLIVNDNHFKANSPKTHQNCLIYDCKYSSISDNVSGDTGDGAFSNYQATYGFSFDQCTDSVLTGNVCINNVNTGMPVHTNTRCIIKNNVGITDE